MRKILFTDREKEAAQLILELLSVGIVLSAALVAPNAVGVVAELFQRRSKRSLQKTVYDMKRRGYVRAYNNHEGSWLALTKKGRARLQKYELAELVIKRPRVWDGKWRIIFFDIPKKPLALNRARDYLRDQLKRLGFVQLQKSVWVHPFPCEEVLAYVVETYGLQPYIRIATAQSLTGQEKLLSKFDL